MGTKIVMIGAGSARFALEMVMDMCLDPSLRGSTVVLVDVDPARLEAVRNVAQRMANELGVDLNFEATTDRRSALAGAQFIINTALAGGRGLMDKDREILEAHGYYRGIQMHASFRQLQLMLEIARDIVDICPDAWVLQCANPVPEGATLAFRETGAKIIGVCHGVLDYKRLAGVLGLDPGIVSCTAIGINHSIWATRLEADGVDMYPMIDDWMAHAMPGFFEAWLKRARNVDYPVTPVAFEQYRMFGLMPIGDTARASTPDMWWFHTDPATKERWYGPTQGFDGGVGHADNLRWLTSLVESIVRTAADPTARVTEVFPPHTSPWQVVPTINSLLTGRKTLQQVNVPNNGQIPGLPNDFYVEVPAWVDGEGVHPTGVHSLPSKVMLGSIVPRWLQAERLIEAHRTGDPDLLLQGYLADNKTRSLEQAQAAVAALMAAEWNADMARHYGQVAG